MHDANLRGVYNEIHLCITMKTGLQPMYRTEIIGSDFLTRDQKWLIEKQEEESFRDWNNID